MQSTKFKIGEEVHSVNSNLKNAIIRQRLILLTGCTRYELTIIKEKSSGHLDSLWVEEDEIKSDDIETQDRFINPQFSIGTIVKHKIRGIKAIVTGYSESLYSSNQYLIQQRPTLIQKIIGQTNSGIWVDECNLSQKSTHAVIDKNEYVGSFKPGCDASMPRSITN
jgi:hypothetical protein